MQGHFSALLPSPGFDPLGLLRALFGDVGDLAAWGLGVARLLPVVTLLPAFGLSAVAIPVRLALAVALAITVLPAANTFAPATEPYLFAFGLELLRGIPLALESSAILWAATMAGGLVDNLRGAREASSLPMFEEPAAPFGAVLGLLAGLAFLESGGAARVALASASAPVASASLFRAAATDLTRAIEIAIAVAAPLAAVSILVELGAALVTRAAAPAQVGALIAPLRSIVLLGLAALLVERMSALFAELAARVPS
jgi:type III secretory pathway component EscT